MLAFGLITCDQRRLPQILESVKKTNGVSKANITTAPYDIIAEIEGDDEEAVRQVGLQMQTIEGLEKYLIVFALPI